MNTSVSAGSTRLEQRYDSAPHPEGGEFWLRPAKAEEIRDLHALIASEIPSGVGPAEIMEAVFAKNSVSFWRIERREPIRGAILPIGMYGLLPLNADGVEALKQGRLDRRNPELAHVAAGGTKPAALYVWAVVARKIGRLTFPLIKNGLGPMYADVPVYAVPATRGGTKAITDRGFAPVGGEQNGEGALSLLTAAGSETARPAEPRQHLEVAVVSNAEHVQMSTYLRGATFGAEQHCPYREEFDGNDHCALHLLGFVDDEPAATLRVRFFASFAKLERLAVLERYRKTANKNLVMEKAIDICRQKGYTRLYGQSQERLVGFYAKFGFRPLLKNRRIVFSDHSYTEIVCDLEQAKDPITIDSDPYLIIRPEGLWDRAGVLEKSAERPATNPI